MTDTDWSQAVDLEGAATGQVMGGFATLEEATTYASNQVGMTP